ncbi:hypothetical protein CLG96_11935 [Sphingomonas oleivorans]|uniref:General secretion pathway protein GspM n=1 Tax=Sphingomonas oleivorans TaxID=1735121 RepID=A0A2T5FVR5_9SPHN|nr:hypothetical protein [Sphingomonas oleivorans]PTQ09871.1 hypothetical protein CLG96_11935 [Sphingomonas oleivorans]
MKAALLRRARPLLPLLLVAGGWAAFVQLTRPALDMLDAARARREAVERIATRPALPPVRLAAPGQYLSVPDQAAADRALRERLREAATRAGVLIERLEERRGPDGGSAMARAHILLSGPEAAMLRFITAVEGGRPAIRFGEWRMERAREAAPAIRFEGQAIAIWQAAE